MATAVTDQLLKELDELLAEPVAAARERARTTFDQEVRAAGNALVLFGAGTTGRQVLSCLRRDGIEPLAFADNQSSNWGRTVEGVPVVSPADAASRYGKQAAFIVTIYNHFHSFPETRQQLAALGCAKVVSVIPLRWKYHETFLPYYRDDLPHKVLEQAGAIREAFNLWADESSRREFVAQVQWRLHGNFDVLGLPSKNKQYFPETEIFRLASDEFLVDVGAYDGDTIAQFLNLRGNNFAGILALEPDPANFEKLQRYVAALPPATRVKIKTAAIAASAKSGSLRFAYGDGTSSSLSEHGSISVECARLDDLLAACRPTYIKMDVEGAELDAIHGAVHTLCEKEPLVAACVYHVQDHLWKIPLALHKLNPHYHLFLRPYMTECWETVCYAVPQARIFEIGQQAGMAPSARKFR